MKSKISETVLIELCDDSVSNQAMQRESKEKKGQSNIISFRGTGMAQW